MSDWLREDEMLGEVQFLSEVITFPDENLIPHILFQVAVAMLDVTEESHCIGYRRSP